MPTENHGSVLPAIFQNATITVQSNAICIENFKFSIQNQLINRPCASAASGLYGFQIGAPQVAQLEFDPEILAVATHPFVKRLNEGTAMAFSAAWTIESNGSTPQKLTLAGSRLQYTGIKPADRNGIRIMQATGSFKSSPNAEDAYLLTYATA
ncbi:MAG: hypothetical protein A3K04_08170 [Gallionellales bacterium RBG_16_56_9]|nr:MAG: hypothetical protein A3K04_08170 [Gallionellales bacterium RBG_16_56_9]